MTQNEKALRRALRRTRDDLLSGRLPVYTNRAEERESRVTGYPVLSKLTGGKEEKRVFNIESWHWRTSCGTICCIGGNVQELMGKKVGACVEFDTNWLLRELFFNYPPRLMYDSRANIVRRTARAIDRYLAGLDPWGRSNRKVA